MSTSPIQTSCPTRTSSTSARCPRRSHLIRKQTPPRLRRKPEKPNPKSAHDEFSGSLETPFQHAVLVGQSGERSRVPRPRSDARPTVGSHHRSAESTENTRVGCLDVDGPLDHRNRLSGLNHVPQCHKYSTFPRVPLWLMLPVSRVSCGQIHDPRCLAANTAGSACNPLAGSTTRPAQLDLRRHHERQIQNNPSAHFCVHRRPIPNTPKNCDLCDPPRIRRFVILTDASMQHLPTPRATPCPIGPWPSAARNIRPPHPPTRSHDR